MKCFFLKRVDSTNLEVRRILNMSSKKEPFWVIANEQHSGKGYGDNHWESEPGMNFTGSLAYFPERIAAINQFQISKLVSLGIADFLDLYLEDTKIKWPNDLYYRDQKIAGILIENEIMGEWISVSVVGLGININQKNYMSDAPNPVSLSKITGVKMDLSETIDLVRIKIENRLASASSVLRSDLDQEYLRKLFRFKEFAPYFFNNRWNEARIVGIGEYGELILEEKSGKTRNFRFKEVEFISP